MLVVFASGFYLFVVLDVFIARCLIVKLHYVSYRWN